LAYCGDLQSETKWLRFGLRGAVGNLAKLTNELQRATQVIAHQRQQLREQRQRRAA
jgi:hypothetical protein